MNTISRGAFLKSAGAATIAFALGGWLGRASSGQAGPPAALETVEVKTGFKERMTGDPAQLIYGRSVRDRLHEATLSSLTDAGWQGHAKQFDIAADVISRVAAQSDPTQVAELWLRVAGSVDGKYQLREFAIEL